MANQGTVHLTEKDKRRNILWDVVVCAACLAEHRKTIQIQRGEVRIERVWMGAPHDCDWCENPEQQAAVSADFANGHRVVDFHE